MSGKIIEEWRPVCGLEGRYEVSSLGRVRSLRFRNRMTDRLRDEPKILRQATQSRGYMTVQLGKTASDFVHALVLEAFAGPRPPGMQAGHINGIRTDNRAENLKWCTVQENADDRKRHNTLPIGRRCYNAKLRENQVNAIRARMASGESGWFIAKEFGVSYRTIRAIRDGVTWKHLLARSKAAANG